MKGLLQLGAVWSTEKASLLGTGTPRLPKTESESEQSHALDNKWQRPSLERGQCTERVFSDGQLPGGPLKLRVEQTQDKNLRKQLEGPSGGGINQMWYTV